MSGQNLDKINKRMNRIESIVYSIAIGIILSCIVLLNIGCIQERYDNHSSVVSVQLELESYVDDFVNAGKLNGVNVKIEDLIVEFKEDSFFKSSTEVGRCSQCYGSKKCTPQVFIKRSYWYKSTTDNLNKRELMFHELGHCILKRMDHKDKKDLAGYPISIMSSTQIGSNLYNETTYKSYDTELFTGINPTAIGEE